MGAVEAAGNVASDVAQRVRQLAVDPHLGVVVDHDLEHDAGAGRIEVADALGDRHAEAVPVEAHAALAETKLRLLGQQRPPGRVVVVGRLGVGLDVERPVWLDPGSERIIGMADLDELDLADACVGVAPLPRHERDPRLGL